MVWIGYVGLTALVMCWIPQSIDTIKRGDCPVNMAFLLLSALGSLSLAFYALSLGNMVFTILNFLTTLGSAVNMYYKIFPRKARQGPA
jgi:MtN3 and saliva related transmembrane protein